MSAQLVEYLSKFVSKERLEVLQCSLRFRTRYLTVCLEDIYQSQNASAVLRSCDAFGIQDVHIIEDKNKYQLNPMVTRGSSKWLDLHKHNNAENPSLKAISSLKEKGYRIVATSPHWRYSFTRFRFKQGKMCNNFRN